MSIADYLSIYAIVAIWGLMFINIFLSIGGIIYYLKINKSDGHCPTRRVSDGQYYGACS